MCILVPCRCNNEVIYVSVVIARYDIGWGLRVYIKLSQLYMKMSEGYMGLSPFEAFSVPRLL